MDFEILKAHGIDAEAGLARCMNDEGLYTRFISMFLKDDTFERAKAAYEHKDYETLYRCIHELKGVSANADLAKLRTELEPLLELLRGNRDASEDEVTPLFKKVEIAYLQTWEGIAKATDL